MEKKLNLEDENVLVVGGNLICHEGRTQVVGGERFRILSGPTRSQIFGIRNFHGGAKQYANFKVCSQSGEEKEFRVKKEYFRSATYDGNKVLFELEGRGSSDDSTEEPFYVNNYHPEL